MEICTEILHFLSTKEIFGTFGDGPWHTMISICKGDIFTSFQL